MPKTMLQKASRSSAIYIVVAVVVFFAINIASNALFTKARIDMTSDNFFTLSDGSKAILEQLDEPVTLRMFFSNKLANGFPNIKSYAARIRGLLEQYADHSGGNVKIEIVDPEPFSEAEDQAVALGLKGAPIDNSGQNLYFGLSIANAADDVESIPFFQLDREPFLEYDITRMIYDMNNTKRIKIGVISTLMMELNVPGQVKSPDGSGVTGGAGSPWAVIQQLRQLYDVEFLDIEKDFKSIPSDVTVLMVVHPVGLSENILYAIDQYVVGGGNALVFLDPFAETGTGDLKNKKLGGFETILDEWGVSFDESKVIADRRAARQIQSPSVMSGQRDFLSKMTSLGYGAESFNKTDLVTSPLNSLMLSSAGFVQAAAGAKTEFTPLIETSTESMRIEAQQMMWMDARRLLQSYKPEDKAFAIAARVSGKIDSAFERRNAKHLARSEEPANVIVVADTDILRDLLWAQMQRFLGYTIMNAIADNGAFVVNAVDNLSGSSDLISLRSRGRGTPDFEVITELKRDAEQRYLHKEQELQKELASTEAKLAQLQKTEGVGSLQYNVQGQREVKRFKQEMLRIRKELRSVRRELDKDIEALGQKLKFINIGLVPILVVLFAIFTLASGTTNRLLAKLKNVRKIHG